jgi:lipid II:glycine glycyltransferase (peptidoglycan interpeptide bridge formation enzyme)
MVNRDEYVEKLKQQLDHWNTEMAKWEAQAKQSQAGMRAEYEKQLTTYRSKRDQAIEQLSKVQSASGEAWKELARGADEAWARMREAFEKASSHFKK